MHSRRVIAITLLFVTVTLLAVGIGIVSVRVGNSFSAAPLTASVSDASPVFFKDDFEGALNTAIWGAQAINPNAITISSDISRTGSHSIKFSFDFADWTDDPSLQPQGHRAEIAARATATSSAGNFELGKTYWVGFSGYMPASWPQDPKTGIIWQFHGRGSNNDDEEKPNGPGVGGSPPLSASVIPNSDRVGIFVRQDVGDGTGIQVKLAEIPLIKGAWNDWVIQVRFSYTDGIVNIWRNGERFVSYSGSTIYHSQGQTTERGPYLKLGIYKPNWGLGNETSQAQNLTLYYDALTIADDRGTCTDVLPSGAMPCEGIVPPITPDTTAPNITLTGANPLVLTQGTVFTDPGARASDDVDGSLDAMITVDSATLDVDTPGTYTVTYRVSDAAGNRASTKRTVIIQAVTTSSCTIEDFDSDDTSISEGDAVTLSWETNNCDNVSLDSYGTVAASGALVAAPSKTTRYTLRADSITKTLQVTVTSPIEDTNEQVQEETSTYVIPDTPETITTQTSQSLTAPISHTIEFTITQKTSRPSSSEHAAPTVPPSAETTITSIVYALDDAPIHHTTVFPDTWTLDTTELVNGWHTIVATYQYQDGTERKNFSFFRVENTTAIIDRAGHFFHNTWNQIREFLVRIFKK